MTVVDVLVEFWHSWNMQFATYFGLKLSLLVFGATEQTSRALQSKNTTVSEIVKMVKSFHHNRELTQHFADFTQLL